MRLRLRPVPVVSSLAMMVLLNACGHMPPPVAPTRVVAPDQQAEPKRGVFKVGQPYQVNGVYYYPSEDLTYNETGIASWYGPGFHTKDTANGEFYDENLLTAAHKTLPLPSIVEVTNLDNGRVIAVRVNDRGPFVNNRLIDMSRRAAQLLGFEQAGTAKVRVKILVPETLQAQAIAKRGNAPPEQGPIVAELPASVTRSPVTAVALAPLDGAKVAPPPPVKNTGVAVPKIQDTGGALANLPPVDQPLPETVKIASVKNAQIYIQAGAFANGNNATKMKAKLDPLGPVVVSGARVNGLDIYRVRIGPIATVEEADAVLTKTQGVGVGDAKIVVE